MTGWVILVDQPKDLPNAETPHKVITTSEYLARPRLFDTARPKLVNLARSYAYQSKGYYASLLAEARGHRVVPVGRDHAGAARGQALRARAAGTRGRAQPLRPPGRLPARGRAEAAGLLRHRPRRPLRILRPAAVRLVPLPGAGGDRRARPVAVDRPHPSAQHQPAGQRRGRVPARVAAPAHPPRVARSQGPHPVAKYDLAVLYDPNEKMPPSSPASIKHFVRIAEKHVGRHRADHASASSPSLPNTTACSSARTPRSTTTPTASRAAPGRRACRSSTIRSR